MISRRAKKGSEMNLLADGESDTVSSLGDQFAKKDSTGLILEEDGASLANAIEILQEFRENKIPFMKILWTKEEDAELMEIIRKFGEDTTKWSEIGRLKKSRTGKQCRERYHNHLRADIKHDAWTQDEDDLLWQLHMDNPGQWSFISRYIKGRSSSAIKNRWHRVNRERQKIPKDKGSLVTTLTKPSVHDNTSLESQIDTPTPSVDSEITKEWWELMLDSSSIDSWDPDVVANVAHNNNCTSSATAPVSPLCTPHEEIETRRIKDEPETRRIKDEACPNLRDNICGMETLSLTVNDSTDFDNYCDSLRMICDSFPRPTTHIRLQSPMSMYHRILSPDKPSPIMHTKRACHMATPRLSTRGSAL